MLSIRLVIRHVGWLPANPDSQLRIDVLASDASESLPEVRPYVPGTPLSNSAQALAAAPKLPYPPTLIARRHNEYFVERESFNVMGMLQNPMMLMMVVAGGLMIGTPYLMVSAVIRGNTVLIRCRKTWTRRHSQTSKTARHGLQAFRARYRAETLEEGRRLEVSYAKLR